MRHKNCKDETHAALVRVFYLQIIDLLVFNRYTIISDITSTHSAIAAVVFRKTNYR